MTLNIEPLYLAGACLMGFSIWVCKKVLENHEQGVQLRHDQDAQWKASVLASLREISDRLTAIDNNKDHPATPVMKELVMGLGHRINEHTRAINMFRSMMFPMDASNTERLMAPPPLPMDDGPGYEEREIAERMAAGVPRNRAVTDHETAIRDFQRYASRQYASTSTHGDDHMTMS
jgi:hypothetical protein